MAQNWRTGCTTLLGNTTVSHAFSGAMSTNSYALGGVRPVSFSDVDLRLTGVSVLIRVTIRYNSTSQASGCK
ncbi:MAG: hypothetical protein ACK56F_11445, partial [bacterium]